MDAREKEIRSLLQTTNNFIDRERAYHLLAIIDSLRAKNEELRKSKVKKIEVSFNKMFPEISVESDFYRPEPKEER